MTLERSVVRVCVLPTMSAVTDDLPCRAPWPLLLFWVIIHLPWECILLLISLFWWTSFELLVGHLHAIGLGQVLRSKSVDLSVCLKCLVFGSLQGVGKVRVEAVVWTLAGWDVEKVVELALVLDGGWGQVEAHACLELLHIVLKTFIVVQLILIADRYVLLLVWARWKLPSKLVRLRCISCSKGAGHAQKGNRVPTDLVEVELARLLEVLL